MSFSKPVYTTYSRCSDIIHVESRLMLKVPHNDACAAHDASHTQGTETNERVPIPQLRKPRTAIMFLVHVSRSPHPFRGHVRVSCSWFTFAFPVHGSRSRFPYVTRVSRSCFSSTASISRSGANVSRSRSCRVRVSHVSARQLL